jgi:translation elongation factor EF-1beta
MMIAAKDLSLVVTLCTAAVSIVTLNIIMRSNRRKSKNTKFMTSGIIFSDYFLSAIEPLYDLHMGCENMGPLLYALIRFLKSHRILEVGAGYTSIYLLQALCDNLSEYEFIEQAREFKMDDNLFDDIFLEKEKPDPPARLDIIDNLEHDSTTAHLVEHVAKRLKSNHYLRVIFADCFQCELTEPYDFIWIDGVTTDERFPDLFNRLASMHLRDGGYIAVHSTLTNTVTRKWLQTLFEEQQRRAKLLQVRFEIKPLDDEIDLEEVAALLQNYSDVEWIGTHRLKSIGFGIQKLEYEALVLDFDVAKALAEKLETELDTLVGSVDVVEDLSSKYSFHIISYLEPHKRFQNSFTILQKRTNGYSEKIYSWSP